MRNPALGNVREIDGLRGLAILAVVLHHFWPSQGSLARFGHIAHLGWVGVDLFFVISGCLITGILMDTRENPDYYRNFYARRVLRIFPLYILFVVSAYIVIPRLQAVTNPGAFVHESGSMWWYLLYVGNIREAMTGNPPAYVLAPTWSLCIEEQFYLTFPLLVAILPVSRMRFLLWGLVFGAPFIRLSTALVWPENERIQYLFTLCRLYVLALGCLLALSFRGQARLPSPRTASIALIVLLLACAVAFRLDGLNRMSFFGRTAGYSLVGVTAYFLVLWVLQRRGRGSTGWLRFTPLCGLGVLCYGLYLLQRPAEVLLNKAASHVAPQFELDSAAGLILKCVAAICIAIASWYLVERPFLRLKRFFTSRTHPVTGIELGKEKVGPELISEQHILTTREK